MPPRCPEEVDVFTVPHSRMKYLVDTYQSQFSKADFADGAAMCELLSSLRDTFHEFQQHEQIENQFIMERLKRRLSSLSVYNSAVCNCHQDNRVTEILETVTEGLRRRRAPVPERVALQRRLRAQLRAFTDSFLPHMEEEERIFQPLLVQYFGYDELRELKQHVLQNHRLDGCQPHVPGAPAGRQQLRSAGDEKRDAEKQVCVPATRTTPAPPALPRLPPELLPLVLRHLSARQRAACARVCREWRAATLAPQLWETLALPPAGDGAAMDVRDRLMLRAQLGRLPAELDVDVDADADDDDSCARRERRQLSCLAEHTLPLVGRYVRRLQLAGCRALGSSQLRRLLTLCPNITALDASYTAIGDCAFKRLPALSLQRLQWCDLSGCERLTDRGLRRLAEQLDLFWPPAAAEPPPPADIEEAAGGAPPHAHADCYDCESQEESWSPPLVGRDKNGRRVRAPAPQPALLRHLWLSGCRRVSDLGVLRLSRCRAAAALLTLDVSGCCGVSGAALHALRRAAPRLQPATLWYCDFVLDGPFPDTANGCDNVDCPIRYCCRN